MAYGLTVVLFLIWVCCFAATLQTPHNTHADGTGSHPHAIPILTFSFNFDPSDYSSKLIRSIDFPVKYLGVQIGDSNPSNVEVMVDKVGTAIAQNKFIHHSYIQILTYNPGSAKGFNFGISLMSRRNESWALIVNNDIEFYPGTLQKLQTRMHQVFSTNSSYGIGFTALCCGGEWSSIILTRRLVDKVGIFDENFYPGYYEDDDYAIRVQRSGFKAYKFSDIYLKHRGINGSVDYYSGMFVSLKQTKVKAGSTLEQSLTKWRRIFERGEPWSRSYLAQKWGMQLPKSESIHKYNCKLVDKINKGCNVPFALPFENNQINHWELRPEAKQLLRDAAIL